MSIEKCRANGSKENYTIFVSAGFYCPNIKYSFMFC